MEMFDDKGFPIFETNEFPLAYLLTFRTYGTWLHGDLRSSVGRKETNHFNGPSITPSVPFAETMRGQQKSSPVLFTEKQRAIVSEAIAEVCLHRNYGNIALNVLTNHAHVVASASTLPEKIVNDFKAYATRRLRIELEFGPKSKIWARGASTRYLWKPKHVEAAINYVLYEQGDIPFELQDAR